jgi:clan AA aspartic protease
LTVKAVLDTGFTDFVTLPPRLISTLQLPYDYTSQFMLADGSVVSVDIFLATVLWDSRPCSGPVLAAEGDPLVGMSMLYGSRVTLDVVDGGQVTIEALP